MTPYETQFQALRHEEARVSAPPHVERAVLAAWDAAHRPSRSSWSLWRGLSAAAAAAILVVSLTVLGGRLRAGLGSAGPQDDPAATLMLVGAPILAGEPVRVVRMRVPASTLTTLGVRSLAGEFADAVDVDVIVGEDGVARAIRLGMSSE
jgi:hypothetical protein